MTRAQDASNLSCSTWFRSRDRENKEFEGFDYWYIRTERIAYYTKKFFLIGGLIKVLRPHYHYSNQHCQPEDSPTTAAINQLKRSSRNGS